MANEAIILGEGVFAIGETDLGLTRGGGQFTVTREYRRINADGDRGPVKGRIRLVSSEATLQINQLELLVDDLAKFFPATKVTDSNGTTKFEGKPDIEAADYNDTVTWTGRTLDGRECVITIKNALNLGNLQWTMAERDEVVSQMTFTATYTEANRLGDEEPWSIEFVESGGEGEEV